MNKLIGLAAGAAIAAAVASSASAGIVYQSTPALNGGGSYWCSSCDSLGLGSFQTLDPFTLGSSANITGVNVVTYNGQGYNGLVPFTVGVYSSDNPSSPIFSQAVTTTLVSSGVDVNGNGYDVVHADLSGLSLKNGQQYWIAFYAPELGIGDSAGQNNGAVQWSAQSGISTPVGDNLEYALFGSGVPEPATWAMMLVGLFGLGALLRTQRKSGALAAA